MGIGAFLNYAAWISAQMSRQPDWLPFVFVWVIRSLVLGACLGFGAWKLVLQSYQLLKVILDKSG
jgi:hypothetical protein